MFRRLDFKRAFTTIATEDIYMYRCHPYSRGFPTVWFCTLASAGQALHCVLQCSLVMSGPFVLDLTLMAAIAHLGWRGLWQIQRGSPRKDTNKQTNKRINTHTRQIPAVLLGALVCLSTRISGRREEQKKRDEKKLKKKRKEKHLLLQAGKTSLLLLLLPERLLLPDAPQSSKMLTSIIAFRRILNTLSHPLPL